MKQQDALQRAIDYLGAVEVGPEFYGAPLYAFPTKLPDVPPWRTCDASTLMMLHDAHIHYARPRAFDIFVTRTKAMPAWWSPDFRFAVKTDDGATVPYHLRENALHHAEGVRSHRRNPADTYAITADLETGEEIAA
jgi:hypothetical protein